MSGPIGALGGPVPGAGARRELAERAAREAGAFLAHAFAKGGAKVEHKGAIDLVTDADRGAQEILLRRIRAAFPGDAVLAEEGETAAQPGLDAPGLWIVDPLDGTTNFAHGHPQWCVSVGWAARGVVQAGVIFDPLRDEMFVAERGRGATRNGVPIEVSKTATLDASLVATGFPYDRRERADYYMAFYRAAVVATQGVRRAGAAALDLAWTACGRHDAYFELGIKPWDVAAGTLLVAEAGGRVSDYAGGPHRLDGANTVATNDAVHEEVLALLAGARASASAAGGPVSST